MPLVASPSITDLNERSREIFRLIVDAYLEAGEPVGSRTLSRRLGTQLSPATIRNVMADLQDAGLLFSPHTSAGRLPTEAGLRLFVNGLLQVGSLTEVERRDIETRVVGNGRNLEQALEHASTALAGLSSQVSFVVAPKNGAPLTHIEFVNIGTGRALVVMVDQNGSVENRIISLPQGLPPSALIQAGNYLQSRLAGRTLGEARQQIVAELEAHRAALDELTTRVVEEGLAVWADGGGRGTLIVKGQARLLDDVTAIDELERIRGLFDALETKESLLRLVDAADDGAGVQIFIGAQNEMFRHAGWSLVLAPYAAKDHVVGAIGVIGPTRLNYARIVPIVDYTAQVIGRLLG